MTRKEVRMPVVVQPIRTYPSLEYVGSSGARMCLKALERSYPGFVRYAPNAMRIWLSVDKFRKRAGDPGRN